MVGIAHHYYPDFSLPEIVGRWWDRTAWEAWKMNGDSWAEPGPYEVSEDSDPLNEQELEQGVLEAQGEAPDEKAFVIQSIASQVHSGRSTGGRPRGG
ncbi:hypothetical protein ACFSQ7_14050 [Paenibacillus rhizoplanae]